jgi:hypothetical protein
VYGTDREGERRVVADCQREEPLLVDEQRFQQGGRHGAELYVAAARVPISRLRIARGTTQDRTWHTRSQGILHVGRRTAQQETVAHHKICMH